MTDETALRPWFQETCLICRRIFASRGAKLCSKHQDPPSPDPVAYEADFDA